MSGRAEGRRVRLTTPQAELLAEIAEAGTLYIQSYRRYGRTVYALVQKGMAVRTEPDYSSQAQHGYGVTDAGRAWLDA